MWDKRAKILAAHDGDTITVVLDQGFWDTKTVKIRLLGAYAPELKDVGGLETKAFVNDWVNRYAVGFEWPFTVTTVRGPRSDQEKTTLSRYLAVVETIDLQHNLNIDVQAFITEHGYSGGVGSVTR